MNLVKRKKNDLWFPSIFDDFLAPDWFGGAVHQKHVDPGTPAANIKETNESFRIEMAVPGKKKEDFNIELEDDILTISSEVKKEHKEKDEKGHYTQKEFGYAFFKRAFIVPDTVNVKAVNAKYEEGILRVDLPKKEISSSNPKKSIDIS